MILTKLVDRMGDMRPEDLAYKTRLSMSTIEKARKGKSIKEPTAILIAQALKCKVTDLTSKPEELVTTGEG
jgi:DNA-binding Xre family transcriptional regulator